jgi:hypothetical protein
MEPFSHLADCLPRLTRRQTQWHGGREIPLVVGVRLIHHHRTPFANVTTSVASAPSTVTG